MAANPQDELGLDRSVFRLMRLGHLIRTTLVYGLAGPPIGAAWFMVSEILDASKSEDWSLGYLSTQVFFGSLFSALFSYRPGFFPALLSGFLLGLLPRQFPLVVLLPLAGIVGWLATSFVDPVELAPYGGLAAMTLAAVTGGLSFGRLGRVEEAVD